MAKRSVLAGLSLAVLLLSVGAGVEFVEAAVSGSHPWTTIQADQQRTSFTQSPAPSNNQTYWTFQTGGPIASSPVVAEGMVFVSSADGYLYAVNATTGSKIWASWVGNSASSPTLTNGRVIVASAGTVFAFDATTGAIEWNQSLSEETSLDAPLVLGTRLFVGGNNTVFAFNEGFGVRLYYETIPHINGIKRLTYTDGLVVAFSLRNWSEGGLGLHGWEAVNTIGRFWVYLEPSGKDRYSSFIENEDATVFAVVQSSKGNSSAFGVTRMGMILWEHQIEGSTQAFPANAYNTTYVPTDKYVYALNDTDGSVLWSHPTTGAASVSSPAVADGKIYFGLDDGYLYALNASDGIPIWSYSTGGPVRSSPAISDGLLFVGSDDGCLYAIGYPKTQLFNAGTWNGTTYEVAINSESAVADFAFNQTLKQLSFEVTRYSETAISCEVTFPSSLLRGAYSVVADNEEVLPFEVQTNETHQTLSISLSQNVDSVTIKGTDAIPEFPTFVPLIAVLCLVAIVAAVRKKKPSKKRIGKEQNL